MSEPWSSQLAFPQESLFEFLLNQFFFADILFKVICIIFPIQDDLVLLLDEEVFCNVHWYTWLLAFRVFLGFIWCWHTLYKPRFLIGSVAAVGPLFLLIEGEGFARWGWFLVLTGLPLFECILYDAQFCLSVLALFLLYWLGFLLVKAYLGSDQVGWRWSNTKVFVAEVINWRI